MCLDSTQMLTSPKISMKLTCFWILYYFAQVNRAEARDHQLNRCYKSLSNQFWAISLNHTMLMKSWNCIRWATMSQWTLCLHNNCKDLMDWLRLLDHHWKISNWQWWGRLSWMHLCKLHLNRCLMARYLICGWANRIHHWSHWGPMLQIWRRDWHSSKSGSTLATQSSSGFLASSLRRVSSPVSCRTLLVNTQSQSIKLYMTSSSWKKIQIWSHRMERMSMGCSWKAADGIQTLCS